MSASKSGGIDAVVIGAGFGGLYALHKLRGLGFSVQGFETGDDVGGTWYWNRYPGARCDVESLDYSYSFDDALQQEWEWTERYATQPEILRYLSHVADRFDLRPLIRFETRVTTAEWHDDERIWRIETDKGDIVTAAFVIMATGSLSAAKPPDIPGVERFTGGVYHTASWPPAGVDFTGQRVGVIGTGSSAIQAIPLIAEQADHVTVFQRTPNFSMPAHNRMLTRAEISRIKDRYTDYRRELRAMRAGTVFPTTGKAVLEVSVEEREAAFEAAWARGGAGLVATFTDLGINPEANAIFADFVRSKISTIVHDRQTAEDLSPRGYHIGTKRVAVDTDYYATFNRDNVTLKNLRNDPIDHVDVDGITTTEGKTRIDALVLATGFDAMTGSFLRVDVRGEGGAALADKWAAGPRTYLGLMSEGFPNLFFVAGPGSPSVLSNMVLSCEQHVEWIADCLVSLRDAGEQRIEAIRQAEDDWVARVNKEAAKTLYLSDTSNSWYLGSNVPGKPRVFMPYVGGVGEYRRICDRIVADGYVGFERR